MSKSQKTDKDTGRNTQIGNQDIIEHDERMVPQFHKGNEIYGEHLARYEASRQLVKDKIVLDVASGSGYGTELLSRDAKKVYGVDVSAEAIEYSKKHFGKKNIEYIVGNGDELPLDSASVEVVTSFETIEHIENYKKFLKEVKRVLKKDGMFVVSTPNDLEFTEGNHFHLHQFNETELFDLLKKDYKYVERYYQTTWLFNLIGQEKSFKEEWVDPVSVMQTTTIQNKQVLYFYFICSDKPIKAKVPFLGAIGEHWSERQIREKEHLTQKHIKNLEDISQGNVSYIRKLEADIAVLQAELEEQKKSSVKKALSKIKKSKK